ncbi:MAG: type VI secretion system baseplate subunit TssK, partial [Holosporales bacterium]|nr:type VI secretion system baseplate subunit TssK [Holosporales bacterium]
PRLEALVYGNEIKPYELYQELAEVLGAVSVLIPTEIFPMMPPYDHNDIDSCLYPIITLIKHYISVIERGFTIIKFNKKDIFFYHYLSAEDFEKCVSEKLYIGVKVNDTVNISSVGKWMSEAVIVSDFAIEIVRTKRIKGAKRQEMKQEDVVKILPGAGITVFEVDIDSKFIKAEQNIHIFNPGNNSKFQPINIMLYLPREKKDDSFN